MKASTIKILLGSLLSLVCVSIHAEGVSTTFTPSAVSQYMFRGMRLGGPAFQPALELASGNLGLGVWASTPIDKKVPGVSDPEIDPYGYYTIAVSDSVSIVPGFTLYTYPDADTGAGFYKSTFEPSLAVSFSVEKFKATPKFYYDTVLKGPTYELTLSYGIPLGATELSLTGTIGAFKWDDAVKGSSPEVENSGSYYQVGVSVPFEVTKTSKVILGLAYAKGYDNTFKSVGSPDVENTMAVGRGVLSLSYAVSF